MTIEKAANMSDAPVDSSSSNHEDVDGDGGTLLSVVRQGHVLGIAAFDAGKSSITVTSIAAAAEEAADREWLARQLVAQFPHVNTVVGTLHASQLFEVSDGCSACAVAALTEPATRCVWCCAGAAAGHQSCFRR